MVLRSLSQAVAKRQPLDVTTWFSPCCADCDLVHGDTPGLGPRRHDLGGAVCVLTLSVVYRGCASPWPGPSCPRTSLAPGAGMISPVAVRASCHPTGIDSAGAGGPRFVARSLFGALCVWAASAAADQQRAKFLLLARHVVWLRDLVRHVNPCWCGRDRLCLAGATAQLYAGGVVG